jgi:hypothetical protein
LREHNRIARELKSQHPDWTSDLLYQTARKIVIAEYNNIIYSEYLPALIATELSEKFRLLPHKNHYSRGYNSKIYPQVINEFATAAFRYGHTQVVHSSHTASRNYSISKPARSISQYLFNNEFYRSSMDDIIRGALVDYSYAANPQVNEYFEDRLFENIFQADSYRWSLPAIIFRSRTVIT